MLSIFRLILISFTLSMFSSAYAFDEPMYPPDQEVKAAEQLAKEKKMNVKPSGFFDSLEGVTKALSAKITSAVGAQLKTEGMSLAGKFNTIALSVAGSLALLYLTVEVLRHLGGTGSSSMLNVVFDVAIPALFAAYLIQNYGNLISYLDILLDHFRNVAPSPIDGVIAFYSKIFTMVSTAIRTTLSAVFSFQSLSISTGIANLADAIAVILFSLFILLILFNSLSDVAALLLLGPFLYAVGVAFGPIMIAGIVSPWTKDYFTKWMGFLVSTAVLTGVVGVVLKIAVVVLNAINITQFAPDQPAAIPMAVSAIMIMALNSLILQAPSIASAMVPGAVGANSSSGSVMSHLKATSNSVKSAGKGAKSVGKSGKGIAKNANKFTKMAWGKFMS